MSIGRQWERSQTDAGMPYYINHKTEMTYWNHPIIMKLERKLKSFSRIKYAAYRTAMKLRAIQKVTCSCNIKLSTIKDYFALNGMDHSQDIKEVITASELRGILDDLFIHEVKMGGKLAMDPLLASELMLNWLLNVHDSARKGTMKFVSVKLTLIIICSGSPREKYNYLFSQIQTLEGYVTKERAGFFLQACLKIPKCLNEEKAFGEASIEPALKHFFQQATDQDHGLSCDFVDWLLAEPQPLVWIPTLYRMAASETVKHEAKCNICKLFPLVGFRYKCLQCFNFDICQECFWTGRTFKSHKLSHPTQEYCMPSSQASDLKDVKKMFKNKFFKGKKGKKSQSSKKRFTEVPPDQQSVKSGGPDYEGMEEIEDVNDNYSEPSNYQAASDYEEDASAVIQNGRPVEEIIGENTWDPDIQPIQRPQSIESLPSASINEESSTHYNEIEDVQATIEEDALSPDQKLELDKIISSLEDDNRELHNQIDTMRSNQQEEEWDQSMLNSENSRLRLEKRRMEERQVILEEHNRLLEMEMQKLRLLLQQQKEDMLTMMEIKESRKNLSTLSKAPPLPPRRFENGGFVQSNHRFAEANEATNSKLRIPAALSIKKSKIIPIYESIPEMHIAPRPNPIRTAWEEWPHEADHGLHYISNPEISRSSLQPKVPTRIPRQLLSDTIHPTLQEEQTLDRTVQWAMENFGFSETESNC